jgi:uncharacterized protein (TIGR03083 family)
MTSDQERLAQYIAAWRITVDDTVALLRDLDVADWSKPTDLPGWDVRAVAAHLAHLESELAGNKQAEVQVPELPHIKSLMSVYTEMGPIARSAWPVERIVDELEESVAKRAAELEADPPTDGAGTPPATPGGTSWTWETLLSNRALDTWMHEQDIRRAVRRPGAVDGPGAAHTVAVLARGFGYTVGKRVAPPTGTTVVLDVRGLHPVHVAVEVNDAGRAVPTLADPDDPTVTLRMDLECFVRLAGGRCDPSDVGVEILGDVDLGERIVAAMAVTP